MNLLTRSGFGLFGLLLCALAARAEEPLYDRIVPPVASSVADKVEVVELFWYSCPHCYGFEPFASKWLETKPAHVEFIRMPAIYPDNRFLPLAKAFYTAETLGVLDKLHNLIFQAFHEQKQRFKDQAEVREFFLKQGISGEDFDKTYDSFAVDMKIRQARTLTAKYGITGVPALVINGKFRLVSEKTQGYANMLQLVDRLVASEAESMGLLSAPTTTATE